MDEGKVFQEVDLFSILKEIRNKNKVVQAKVLQELEKYITNPEDFSKIRKFFLDEQNEYTRGVVGIIFGDIEFLNTKR